MLSGDVPYGCSWTGGTAGTITGTPAYPATYFMTVSVEDASPTPLADTMAVRIVVTEPPYICGDCDGNRITNISDVVYLLDYIFGGGPPPDPLLAGDVDCDGLVNVSDAVYMLYYIFGSGREPCDPDGDGVPDC
jgi:hypothetical protein